MCLRAYKSIVGLMCLALLSVTGYSIADEPEPQWIDISTSLVQSLTDAGQKTDWPGQSAGVAVDPASGDVYMIVAGLGIYKSSDLGKSFARVDGGKVGGRCETSYSLNVDPAGKQLACFMLDGKCAWTGDAGKTWTPFTDVGRNWDYAAVDWSDAKIQTILAALHESGGKVMLSTNGGQAWKQLFEDDEFDKSGGLGVFDSKTLVYTQKGKGIQRSSDVGQSWTKVSDHQPIGRLMVVHKQHAYWSSKEGLLVSTDQGQSWNIQGTAVDASIGPYFDPNNDQRIVVAGAKGIFQSNDAGQSWKHVAKLPAGFEKLPKNGWYSNVTWDPVHNVYYASLMGRPTYRLDASKR